MEALIAELEAATEGSRELSDKVAVAIGWKQAVHGDEARGYFVPRYVTWESPDGTQQPPGEWWPPPVTQSLDAAITLVPEGMLWQVGTAEGEATVIWESAPSYCTKSSTGESWASDGDTLNPALSVCIAALKARQAMKDAA